MNAADKYNQWHDTVHGGEDGKVIILQQWHADALALAPELKDKAVLEVGCGAGDFSFALEARGARVTGLDFSAAAISIANRKKTVRGSSVNFVVGDACNLPVDGGSYDVVFSCECIEHVPDPQQAVREMARALRPGGSLVLTTENYTNAMALLWIKCWLTRQPFNSGTQVQPIEHFFLFPMIKGMIRRSGLKLSRTTAAHHVFLLLPRTHPQKFTVERFRHWLPSVLFKWLGRHWSFCAVKPLV